MFRSLASLTLVLALAGCATASISQSLIAENELIYAPLGGANYPVVIEGAGIVGLTPDALARGLRFPGGPGGGSSFRAVLPSETPSSYAVLSVKGGTRLVRSTLTFIRNGERIGLGTFSMPQEAYADPNALGRVSSTLIIDMLNEANRRATDQRRWRWNF